MNQRRTEIIYPCARRLITERLAKFRPAGRTGGRGRQRLQAVMDSSLGRYWTLMTGQPEPETIPVPKGIRFRKDERWTAVDEASSPEESGRAVIDMYRLSVQDQIQIRDTLRYPGPDDGMGPVQSPRLEAFAKRICLQFNEIFRHIQREFSATAITFPEGDDLRACRFQLVPAGGGGQVGLEASTRERFEGEIIPEARKAVSMIAPEQGVLRIYREQTLWTVGANRERLWSEASALDIGDHMIRDMFEAKEQG